MKRNPMQALILITLVVVCGAKVLFGAAGEMAQEKPPTDAQVQSMLQSCVVEQRRAPGIVVGLIDVHGAKVFARGVRENGKNGDVQVDTVFEIGSITKVFTAILLQDMVDRGEVKLDDPIDKFLPASVKTPSRSGRQITLLDLATQTSGLPRMPDNFAPGNDANPYADYTVERLYDFLSHYQLTREIGAEYEYSNLGGGLLGHALALRAGTNYEELVIGRICNPLHLDSTRITLSPGLKSRLASGHNRFGMPVSNWDLSTLAGAGALRSTASDLLVFVAANLGLTNCSLTHAMMQTHLPRHSTGSIGKIGLMWQIDSAHETLWHNGGTGGYHSYIGFKMAERRGVVVLANSQNDIDDIGRYLLGDRAEVKDFTPPKAQEPGAK
jgi:CubicO group peptidase (beta-lactamase class C family)